MDPFSAEGKLLTIHNAFHQGQYHVVLDFDTSSLSESNVIPARVLELRAHIASGSAQAAMQSIKKENGPDFAAVKAFAQYSLGDTIAIITQIHLQQNRSDLALKEVSAARTWAQDSLLVNIAESWVGMRIGGESYQSAFYVFEEMAQTPFSTSTKSLVSQAILEFHLGLLPEAEATLNQALQNDPKDIEAIANAIVLATIMWKGEKQQQYLKELKKSQSNHALLTGLEERSNLFDQAAGKYAAKVA
ncbi:MAG: hypothetical protein LQ338_007246 [Usnochroma carphineum]|nr:MAG: hypothetical protein LQ338_007246 [Usnochroma carphineum]